MIESGVDLQVGGVDRVGAPGRRVGVRLTDQAGEWPEETQPELDQQDAQFQPDRSQAVASGLADTLDEAFRAELAQVVPKLAETVLVRGEVMASDDAGVQLTRRPVADETTGMEQRLEDTNHPVVMQLEAGDTTLSDDRWWGGGSQWAGFDGAGQQLGLFGEATLIGGGKLLAQQR